MSVQIEQLKIAIAAINQCEDLFRREDLKKITKITDQHDPKWIVGLCNLFKNLTWEDLGDEGEAMLSRAFYRLYGNPANPFEQFGASYFDDVLDYQIRADKCPEIRAFFEDELRKELGQ